MFVEIQDSDRHDRYHRAIVATVTRFREDHGGQNPTVLVVNDELGLLTAMAVKTGAKTLVFGPSHPPPEAEVVDTLESPVADVLVCHVHGNYAHAMQNFIASAQSCVRHDGRYCIPQNIYETVTPCAWTWTVGPDDGAAERARAAFFRRVIGRFGSRGLANTADAPIIPATSGRLQFVSTGPTTRLRETESIVVSAPTKDSVPAIAIGWTATLADGIDLDNNPRAYQLTPGNTPSAVARAMVCGLWIAGGIQGNALPHRLTQGHRSIEGVPVIQLRSPGGIIVWSNEFKASRQDDEIKHLLADIVTANHTPVPEGSLFYDAPTAAVMAAAESPDTRYLASCPSMVARTYMATHHKNLAVTATVNRLHVPRTRLLPAVVHSTVSKRSCPRKAVVVIPSATMEAIAVRFDPVELGRRCCPAAPEAAVNAIRRWLEARDYKSWPLCGLPWAAPAPTDGKLVIAQRKRGDVGASGIINEFLVGHTMAIWFGPRKLILVE